MNVNKVVGGKIWAEVWNSSYASVAKQIHLNIHRIVSHENGKVAIISAQRDQAWNLIWEEFNG